MRRLERKEHGNNNKKEREFRNTNEWRKVGQPRKFSFLIRSVSPLINNRACIWLDFGFGEASMKPASYYQSYFIYIIFDQSFPFHHRCVTDSDTGAIFISRSYSV